MPRPECHVYIAASLDGFIARKDGALDFLEAVQREGEDYGFAAFYATVDTLVMGRATWEVACGFPEWPYGGKRVVVLTHRPAEARHGETFASGDVGALVERLHDEGCKRIYVDGGVVIREFLEAGVVDELTVSIVPRLLGAGLPLFGAGVPDRPLRLLESRSWESGLVQVRYAMGASG